ncbi:MAG: multicopper oxidase domain-containing protein [Gammaproteobacteria bacterium]|nr:multicopper oxidase domain-containing protein [Gammaproteobacteria bacterium]
MVNRRFTLKLGAAAGAGLLSRSVTGQIIPQSGLVFPSGYTPSWVGRPSPPVRPFVTPLFQMPIAQPVPLSALDPPPDPARHQRYNDFLPKKFYIQNLEEIKWAYHIDPPYNQGSWVYGFDGIQPGPTFITNYGEPLFVRRNNRLPPVGQGKVTWALPSFSIHTHNGHQASESDGFPSDFADPGQFWDHHYPSFPAGFDPTEVMGTLWYHDHRLDFTATNVYAGFSGFFLAFDERDSNNENDKNPKAFRLPSGKYDVPLILHDISFGPNAEVLWDFVGAHPSTSSEPGHGGYNGDAPFVESNGTPYTINGMIGDMFTVNRIIQPYLKVERRKYRLRLLNGGPSRNYSVAFTKDGSTPEKVFIISNEGNLLPHPIEMDDYFDLWPANRYDIIIDFSKYQDGDYIYLTNRMEERQDGAGETGRYTTGTSGGVNPTNLIMRFDVVGGTVQDPSHLPDHMIDRPLIDLSEVKRERLFVFDYTNGLFTINGRLMDPNRIDAAIEQGSAEIWTLRNDGDAWSHPIHTHFEEFQIIEINGKPVPPGSINWGRKDVVQLGPGDEVKFFGRWRDFFGKFVMHCHNVVHEDHAMMIRWDIVPPGQGY